MIARTCLALAVTFGLVAAAPAAPPKPDEKSKAVDESIKKALEHLKSTQSEDGSWSAGRGAHPAITALSVMAFLAAGHVPGEGPYGKTVEKGIRAVLKMQAANGLIATERFHEMYHHGICTLMLAEVAGMTQGELAKEVRQKLEKAVAIVLTAQRKGQYANDPNKGGWRYMVASTDADMSVSGWQVLALRAAKNLGCDVPPEAIDRAVEYLKRSQQAESGGFCYTPYGGVTIPCTGTGVLALCVCGKDGNKSPEAIKGGNYLVKTPPRWGSPHFFYSIYYCTQATFQLGGNYWEFFRPQMHDVLLKNQKPNGSWDSREGYGTNYSTSMGVLALAVEYRFLPIYQRGEEPGEKK